MVRVVAVLAIAGTAAGCGGDASTPPLPELLAGASAIDLTPAGWEVWDDVDGNAEFDEGEEFADCGRDRLCPGDAGYVAPDADGSEGDGVFQSQALGGYGGALTGDAIRPLRDVHDPVWARALAVTKGGETFVLVSLDFAGFVHIVANPVKRRVAAELGLGEDRIITSATHNHEGPDVTGFWSGGLEPVYTAQVSEGLFQAISQALETQVPATLTTAQGEPEHGCWDPVGERLKAPADCNLPEAERAEGTWDRELWQSDTRDPVVRNLAVTAGRFDAADGSGTVATLINWNNHPEILGDRNNRMSSDFPHFARQRIEERYGGVAVYVSGTTGSQVSAINHADVPLTNEAGQPVFASSGLPKFADDRSFDKIRSLGWMVGDVAIGALEAPGVSAEEDPAVGLVTGSLKVPLDNVRLQVGVTLFFDGEDMADEDRVDNFAGGYCEDVLCVATRVHIARIGEISAVSGPGEVAPEYLLGRPESSFDYGEPWGVHRFPAMGGVAAHLPGRFAMAIDIADTYLGYMVPRADYLPPDKEDHPNYFEDLASAGERYGDLVYHRWLELLDAPKSAWIDPDLVPQH